MVGLVAPLRCLDHFAMQRLEIVLHSAERRLCRALERRIERRYGAHELRHLCVDRARSFGERFFDGRRNLRLE